MNRGFSVDILTKTDNFSRNRSILGLDSSFEFSIWQLHMSSTFFLKKRIKVKLFRCIDFSYKAKGSPSHGPCSVKNGGDIPVSSSWYYYIPNQIKKLVAGYFRPKHTSLTLFINLFQECRLHLSHSMSAILKLRSIRSNYLDVTLGPVK